MYMSTENQQSTPEPQKDALTTNPSKNIERIMDLKLELVVRIGYISMKLKDVLDLYPGSILEVDKSADGPLELVIGNKKLAEGEVVTVGENLGLRIIKH
jgi:flagellar motor switch protein FliN/FliY